VANPVFLRLHALELVEMPSLRQIFLVGIDGVRQSEPIRVDSLFVPAAHSFDAALCPLQFEQILGLISHIPISPFLRRDPQS
jgi:hypothetical protein